MRHQRNRVVTVLLMGWAVQCTCRLAWYGL